MKENGNVHDKSKEPNQMSWSVFMDKNIHYLKYILYGVGIGGLAYAAYSLRLTTKFSSVAAIPDEFFQKQFKLYGNVKKIATVHTNGKTFNVDLHVEHEPIIRMRSFTTLKLNRLSTESVPNTDIGAIAVRIPAVQIKDDYLQPIEAKLLSRKVSFVLLQKMTENDAQYALALVCFWEKRWISRSVDFGSWIVDNGFGLVSPLVHFPALQASPRFEKYYANLLKLEERAAKQKKGMWKNTSEDTPSKSIPKFTGFIQWFSNCIKRVYKRLK